MALVLCVFILCCCIFLLRMHVCFYCVRFSFSVLSTYEERLRNDLFCVGWDVKPKLKQPMMVKHLIMAHYDCLLICNL